MTYIPRTRYGQNLVAFTKLIRKHQPQAQLAWLSSTPMHFDMHLNANVVAYNALAHKLLVGGTSAGPVSTQAICLRASD